MAIELYNAHQSTCSQKVRMTLAEKGLPWDDHQIVFRDGDHLSDWYLKLNPNGVVPTMVHDGTVLLDSSAINEYLEDAFPETPLRPGDAKTCAQMRYWRQYIDEVPTPSIRVPSFQLVFRNWWAQLSPEEFEQYTNRLPIRKYFYRQMRGGGFSSEQLEEADYNLAQTLQRMEDALSDGRPWLIGEQFTLADVSIMPTIVRMEDLGLSHMWAEHRNVTAWYARLQERPAFAATYYDGARLPVPRG